MRLNIVHYLFPRVCPFCESENGNSEFGLCASCGSKMELLDPASEQCMRRDSNCYVCAVYSGRIASAVISFKKGRLAYKAILPLFIPHIRTFLSNAGERVILSHPPGSMKSRLKRGFDHMSLVCRIVSRLVHGSEYRSLFIRHASASQKALNKEDRKKNMEKAISIRRNSLKGIEKETCILIIDDVITTGATLSKARNLLEDEGYTNVRCLALLSD